MSIVFILSIIFLLSALAASLMVIFWQRGKIKVLRSYERRWHDETRRLEDLQSHFLANMSHELRTPLTVVKGYTDLLESWAEREHLDSKYQVALEKMRSNENFLQDILNSILDFAKVKVGLRHAIMARAKIHALFGDLRPGLEEKVKKGNLTLRIDIGESVPEFLRIDAVAVKQIINNLVENAVKFTPSGSVILSVDWEAGQEPARGVLVISTTDTGVGIAEADLKKIFEPFVQVESSMSRRYGGTGLGLSICRELAASMGGTLTATSRPGAGSRFELRLPLQSVSEGEADIKVNIVGMAESRVLAADRDHQPKRILVVEDSEDTMELLLLLLKNLSIEVIGAKNGREAIEAVKSAEQKHTSIDAVLMDMQMPIMNGYQATKILRRRGFKNPIIAVTAHSLQGDEEKCLASGCTDYLSKPIDWNNLVDKLRAV